MSDSSDESSDTSQSSRCERLRNHSGGMRLRAPSTPLRAFGKKCSRPKNEPASVPPPYRTCHHAKDFLNFDPFGETCLFFFCTRPLSRSPQFRLLSCHHHALQRGRESAGARKEARRVREVSHRDRRGGRGGRGSATAALQERNRAAIWEQLTHEQ